MTELQEFMLAVSFGCSCGGLIAGLFQTVLDIIDLVKYKHAYDLSSKVISVMNQIYSKLIEETGL